MKKHPQAFAALKSAIGSISLGQVAAKTGLTAEQIQGGGGDFCGIAPLHYSLRRRHRAAAERLPERLEVIDLAWITGKLGRPGCGVNTVTEEPNEQGAVDMGVAPEFLPGLASFDDQTMRDKLAKAWDATLPTAGSGAHLTEILKRCRSGQIRALYVVGENPLATLPASMEVRAALDRLELLVVQDPFLTETGQMAHVVLPATTSCGKGWHLYQS